MRRVYPRSATTLAAVSGRTKASINRPSASRERRLALVTVFEAVTATIGYGMGSAQITPMKAAEIMESPRKGHPPVSTSPNPLSTLPSMLRIGCPDRHALLLTSAQNAPSVTRALPRERVRCVPGMLNSSEVKVLYPTGWR